MRGPGVSRRSAAEHVFGRQLAVAGTTAGRRPGDRSTGRRADDQVRGQLVAGPWIAGRARRVCYESLGKSQSAWRRGAGACGWRSLVEILSRKRPASLPKATASIMISVPPGSGLRKPIGACSARSGSGGIPGIGCLRKTVLRAGPIQSRSAHVTQQVLRSPG